MKNSKEKKRRRKRRERQQKKIGTPAGTFTYVGEHPGKEPQLRIFDYDGKDLEELHDGTERDLNPFLQNDRVTWIDVQGLDSPERIGAIGEHFGLHSLLIEDVLNAEHRPKFEDHQDHLFLTLKMLALPSDPNAGIHYEQVSLVLGASYVISFQEKEGDVFDPIRKRLQNPRGKIRNGGPDHLFYALLDAIVDHYFLITDRMEERIEELENAIVEETREVQPQEVHALKKEAAHILKSVSPMREAGRLLLNSDNELIPEKTERYLRDVHDHIVAVTSTLENQREMASGLMDSYMSFLTLRMNNIMKVLTVIASIFIPLTFIAGVYGMNFEHMPELAYPWAYPAILGFMLLVAIGMTLYFKKKKWI